MKLRTKLILAFLLMSVVPLTAIVLYSYYSSLQTLRIAALNEVLELTTEIGDRVDTIRDNVGWGVQQLGAEQFGELLSDPLVTADHDRFLSEVGSALGEAAPYVESLQFVPLPPEPTDQPAAKIEPLEAGGDSGLSGFFESVVIHLGESTGRPEAAADALEDGLEGDARREIMARIELDAETLGFELVKTVVGVDVEQLMKEARQLEELAAHLDSEAGQRRDERELEAAEQPRRRVLMVEPMEIDSSRTIWRPNLLEEDELEQMEAMQLESKRILGREFDGMVERQGRQVGRLKAQISARKILERILHQSRRDEGEIPFAVDGEGNLYVAREEDRSRLEGLPLTSDQVEQDGWRDDLDDWVIVRLEDGESGLVYGIARPIGRSLSELRRTTGRNLAAGLGLIGLALLGIAPLSGRITRDLKSLAAGAEEFARGNLDSRVAVRSRDEVGHLARTLNQMAEELQQKQTRLIEQERLSKEHEIQRRLLEVENSRKGEELEAARRFQISLLPKQLPVHPELDIGVFMQTATEVGGDYYDFHLSPDRTLTAAIGDATGHGAKAGTMVTVIKSLFTAEASESELTEFLTRAARSIRQMDLGRMAMALTLARYDEGLMTVAAAGMPPALIHRAASGEVQEVALEGLPLGSMSDSTYDERKIDLCAGDTVLLMSDGFPELASEGGEPLGYARVLELFRGAASGSTENIIARLAEAAASWSGSSKPSDDITFLVLQRKT